MTEKTRAASVRARCCPVLPAPLAESDAEAHARRFKALADPTRVRIISLLARSEEPICVCDITACFPLGQPTISYHLKLLRDAGLVDCRREGLWCYYYIREDAQAWLRSALGHP